MPTGTPLGDQRLITPREALQAIALFRLVLPSAWLRLAGGREFVLGELQAMGLLAGANALIVGNYLTSTGRPAEEDHALLEALGMPVADGPGEGRFVVDAARRARPPGAARRASASPSAPSSAASTRSASPDVCRGGRCGRTPRAGRAGRGRTGRRAPSTRRGRRPPRSPRPTTSGSSASCGERRCRGTATRTARSLANAPERIEPAEHADRQAQPAAAHEPGPADGADHHDREQRDREQQRVAVGAVPEREVERAAAAASPTAISR